MTEEKFEAGQSPLFRRVKRNAEIVSWVWTPVKIRMESSGAMDSQEIESLIHE